MVFLAPSELVRLSVSKKWDCSISEQRVGSYSALGTLHDTECSEYSMEKRTLVESEPPAVKRKRGRPRKVDTLAGQGAVCGIAAPQMKRKRGRPRKADILTEQVVASGIQTPQVKRKRGRPRKADILSAQVAANGMAASAVKRKPGRPRKADFLGTKLGPVNDSDSEQSLFPPSYDSNSSADSDYDDYQTTPNLTQSFQINPNPEIDIDDPEQMRSNASESSELNSSSGSDSDEDDHSSDEDFNYLKGHTRPEKKNKRRRNGDVVRYKETSSGVICHWCRQRSERIHVQCSLCVIKFCLGCLLNRHGEKIKENTEGARWVCPRCRNGCGEACENCCNCGPCRRSQGKPPTGLLAPTARKAGFSNVHDYLINLATGESAEVIAMRKEGRGWTEAIEAVGSAVEESPIPPWGVKKLRTPKIPLGYLISKCREGRETAMACEVAEASEPDSPWLEREKQDSCPVNLQVCQLSSTTSNASESPPLLSMEAGVKECWRPHGAIPTRKRSLRKTAVRKEKLGHDEVEHDKRPDLDVSHTECAGDDQGGLPDLNIRCEEEAFKLPDLNSPFITSTGGTISHGSGQEITGATAGRESGGYVPLSAESTESSFSVRTHVTSANEAEVATSNQVISAAQTLVGGNEFRIKLDLVLQRPFSSEQLKEMWDHFMFHRPSQQEEHSCHGSSNEEADELLCDYFSDLYEQLARTFSAAEKLKLLRAFFFWLQHSSMEGAFQPWVTDGEDDQFGGCTPVNISDSRVIDRLLAIDENICKYPVLCLPKDLSCSLDSCVRAVDSEAS